MKTSRRKRVQKDVPIKGLELLDRVVYVWSLPKTKRKRRTKDRARRKSP